MPLFIFDDRCVDRSVTYTYEVRAVLLWCPLPWLPFLVPWPEAVGGTRDMGDHRQRDVRRHVQEG